jgi:hypothetical protein
MLKNNDSTLYQIMPIEIKLEETFFFKKGEEKGKVLGEKRGVERGEKKIHDKIILTMLKKKKFSIEEIAEVSVEYVKELLKQSS